jgi:hypothetical protein
MVISFLNSNIIISPCVLPITNETQGDVPSSYPSELGATFSAEKGHRNTPNVVNVAASNYIPEMMDKKNFKMENYQASKKRDNMERMARRSGDHLSCGVHDSTGDK